MGADTVGRCRSFPLFLFSSLYLRHMEINSPTEEKILRFAFWQKENYPFVQGAKATKIRQSSSRQFKVWVPSYHMWVKPFALYSIKKGLEIRKSLLNLQFAYQREKVALERKHFSQLLDTLLPESSEQSLLGSDFDALLANEFDRLDRIDSTLGDE